MEFFIGLALALGVVVFARVAGLDRDRSFYPVLLVVIASYYDLFAVLGGSGEALAIETLVLALFVFLAVIGFKINLWAVVGALVGHGTLDFFHGDLIANPGVPAWWPTFCLTFDLAAGAYLACLLHRSAQSGVRAQAGRRENALSGERNLAERSSFRSRISPYVDIELRAASVAERTGDAAAGFGHLERAHVLGQSSTIEHVRVHARMFAWGLRRRDVREVAAQILRIVGAATKTALNAIPHGNTGGSKVSAFRSMSIPSDLATIIASASTAATRRGLSAVLVIGMLVTVGGCDATPKDIRFASGEGHSIAYRVLGTGQPVIVLISGLGDGMSSFKDVAPELAKGATVIVYDRAGYGVSGPAAASADAVAADQDLSMMLKQSGVPAPYVLIGHSLGGLFAEYYAAKHPEQVSGLILVDSRPADFTRRCEAAAAGHCTPPAFLVKFMDSGARAEFAALAQTMDEVEAAAPVEGKAVLVLSRPVASDANPLDLLWSQAQGDLAGRYSGVRHLTAPGGGHYIHQDQAGWFVATVREFLAR